MTSQDILTAAEYRQKISEHALQVQVMDYIEVEKATPDVYPFAIPNAGLRSFRVAARLKREGLRPGFADIGVMLPMGRIAWLELKTVKGRQSPEQKIFASRCERLGHPYAVAKTFDEAVMFLKYVGALR